MSSEDSVKESFKSFAETFGSRLDIMVNCAGIVGPTSIKTEDIPLDKWETVQAGTTYMVHAHLTHEMHAYLFPSSKSQKIKNYHGL